MSTARLAAAAVLLAAFGAPWAAGWGALALTLGAALGIAALVRGVGGPARAGAWGAAVGAPLALLTVFTLQAAAPNIVIAGQKAAERTAVSTLRTLLWAQDTFVSTYGRAALIAELSGARPVQPPLEAELLRAPFRTLVDTPQGAAADVSGYRFAVFVRTPGGVITEGGEVPPGAVDWIAYAWPSKQGATGFAAFCVNRFEDILETTNDQGYSGSARAPAWNACVVDPAAPELRLTEGEGGDGHAWRRWRGKQTRRAKAAE